MAEPRTLKVLLLSDGLPGHGNQARGLVSWLRSRYTLDCSEQEVRLRLRSLARLLLPWLLRLGRPGCRLACCFYRGVRPQSADLILSAGGNTSFINVALARLYGVPNVFLGSKRRLRSDDFSAHLTLQPTGEPHNIVMDLVPTPADPVALKEAGAALRRQLGLDAERPLYALIVGGEGAGYRYDDRAWRQMAELVAGLAQRDGGRWLLTTSRRTGADAESVLRASVDEDLLADAVWWSEAPRKVMNAYLGAADALFVTADSMSMINECIASGKPTLLLEPAGAKPDSRYRAALARFAAAGYCRQHPLGEALPALDWRSPGGLEARERLLDALAGPLGLDS